MNKKYLAGGALVVVIIAAAAVWFLFLKDEAPDAVDNASANDALSEIVSEEPESTTPTAATEEVDGIDGVWVVDSEIGTVEFETATGSFAGFRVAEELTVGSVTAVGRSGGIDGTVTIENESLVGAEVTVDMTTILSNNSRREGAIRGAINAADFPEAVFTFDDAGIDVSSIEVGGDAQSFAVGGQLTVAGVTNDVVFDIEANVRDDGFAVITGSTEIVWEDFDVTPPSAPAVVSIADEGTVEFQLILSR